MRDMQRKRVRITMAKLPNVTEQELNDIVSDGITQELWSIHRRLEKGYVDPLKSPLDIATRMLSLSRAASDVASKVLATAQMEEYKRQLAEWLSAFCRNG